VEPTTKNFKEVLENMALIGVTPRLVGTSTVVNAVGVTLVSRSLSDPSTQLARPDPSWFQEVLMIRRFPIGAQNVCTGW
jgi:hypothetical protein